VDYYYQGGAMAAGNVSQVIRQVVGEPKYYNTDLVYNRKGEVWFVVNRSWKTFCGDQPIDSIGEFQGGGRGRMMVRERDPNDVDFVLPGTTRWTLDTPRTLRVQTRPCRAVRQGQADYDGDEPYGDFSVSFPGGAPQVDEQTAYLPGIGQIDATTGQATYVYADHLGTARAAMVPGDEAPRYRFYTAFGEPVDSSGTGVPPVSVTDFCDAGASPPFCTRYQYVGAHGYETGLVPDDANYASANWQHVGHRWYDPASGRFLQRDPIGIAGGLNVYEYADSDPLTGIDPLGLDRWVESSGIHTSLVYGNPCIGFWRIEIKWRVPKWGPWWHWPKDFVELTLRGATAITVGTEGEVVKTPAQRPSRPPDVKTTIGEDAALHSMYEDGECVYYNLYWRNCRTFVNDARDFGQ